MTSLIFFGGLAVGFLIARYFVAPMFVSDLNNTLQQDINKLSPAQKAQFKKVYEQQASAMHLSPAEIQQGEQQFGFQGRMTIS